VNKICDVRSIGRFQLIQSSLPVAGKDFLFHYLAGILATSHFYGVWFFSQVGIIMRPHRSRKLEVTYWNCMLLHVHYVGSNQFYKLATTVKPQVCLHIFISTYAGIKLVLSNYCCKTTVQNLQTGLITSG